MSKIFLIGKGGSTEKIERGLESIGNEAVFQMWLEYVGSAPCQRAPVPAMGRFTILFEDRVPKP